MIGKVLITPTGEFIRVSTRLTHTGQHVEVLKTACLNEASVFDTHDRARFKRALEKHQPLIAIDAEVVTIRTVTLLKGEENATS